MISKNEENLLKFLIKELTDILKKTMAKNPDSDALTIIDKAISEFIDKLAIKCNWSADRKAKFIDEFLDNYNLIKK
jgi:hypothetical protein